MGERKTETEREGEGDKEGEREWEKKRVWEMGEELKIENKIVEWKWER